MIGRTPVGISTLRPLSHGVIADFEMTRHMIRHYMARAGASGGVFSHPRVAVCVPASVTEVEKRAVVEVTLAAGAKEAFVVEEPLAAAVGIGLPINEAQGNMVVNMGGGTCEVAVMSLGGIVINQSLRVAGEAIDEGDSLAAAPELHARHRRKHGGGDKDSDRLRHPARAGASHGRQGARPRRRTAEGRHDKLRRGARRDRAHHRADRGHDTHDARTHAAGAGARHRRPGHRALGRHCEPSRPSTSASRTR